MIQQRKVLRRIIMGVGAVILAVSTVMSSGSGWMLASGLVAMFLGVTDFGRQCPLILSARHLAYRLGAKKKSHVISVTPFDEVCEDDHKK